MRACPADTAGWLYILCFDRPLGNPLNPRALASHYLGWCLDLAPRVATHAAGHGAAITQAAVAQGITWQVFYRAGTPGLERWLKAHYKHTPRCCPRCAAARGRRPAHGFQPIDQLALPLDEAEDFPAALVPTRMDYYEIAHLRGYRLTSRRAAAGAGSGPT